jgi:flavin-dependent dehydrogenase
VDAAAYDALIIGGGPGGSTAATYLARQGKKVILFEKEVFPRFHIGESLLPYNQFIFEEMGVLPALEAAGFPYKYGAQFHLGNGSKSTKFVFRNGVFTKQPRAFQVERSKFDHILLRHASSSGAEVQEGCAVLDFKEDSSGASIRVKNNSGTIASYKGAYLIDASGRGNLTANLQKIRVVHPDLKKVAIFGHFTGVGLDVGEKAGDTVIVRLRNKWFWLIPISAEKVSVGCVMDQEEFASAHMTPEQAFYAHVAASKPMTERMREGKLVGQIQTTGDFSYHNQRFVGERLIRVGDAAGFMDPIFSAGVYLAMYSGRLAAKTVLEAMGGKHPRRGFEAYEARVRNAMQFYWELVESFYTTPFMEIFLEPRNRFNLPSAVNAVLAGELEGGWAMRWRMRLFFWLIKLQARWPLVPRIRFE